MVLTALSYQTDYDLSIVAWVSVAPVGDHRLLETIEGGEPGVIELFLIPFE